MATLKSTKNKIVANVAPGIGIAIGGIIVAFAAPFVFAWVNKARGLA